MDTNVIIDYYVKYYWLNWTGIVFKTNAAWILWMDIVLHHNLLVSLPMFNLQLLDITISNTVVI